MWSFVLIALGDICAQDPVFSQFNSSPVLLNSAFAGTSQAARFALNYRNQWPSLPGNYESYAVSYDQFFKKYSSAIGGSILMDNAGNGIFQTIQVDLHYSYRLQINRKWFAKFGTDIGLIQNRLDWDKLIFLDQLDPVSGLPMDGGSSQETRPDQLNTTFLDLGAGFLAYNGQFYIGLGAKHLNSPDQSFLMSITTASARFLPDLIYKQVWRFRLG